MTTAAFGLNLVTNHFSLPAINGNMEIFGYGSTLASYNEVRFFCLRS